MEVLAVIDGEDVWKEYEMEVCLDYDSEDVRWKRDVEYGDPERRIEIIGFFDHT